MIDIRKLALCAAIVFALSACNEGSEDLAEGQETAPATATPTPTPGAGESLPPPEPEKIIPVEVAADAIAVGTKLQGDVVVRPASNRFATSDTVYASAPVRGKPAGAEAKVYWTYQDGTAHKEEIKKLTGSEQHIAFSFAKADGMKPGKYNVEIDVNMVPIGIVDFEIR